MGRGHLPALHDHAKARKYWKCNRCESEIGPGERYYYLHTSSGRQYSGKGAYSKSRVRYCQRCRLAIEDEARAYRKEELLLKAKYDEKLSHEFVEYGGWTTDYDAARKKAEEEGKVLFVYFSRSYAP